MMIYFAGPLFSQSEQRFNANVTAQLELLGYEVFLPQRDGIELARDKSGSAGLTAEEKRQKIFDLDTSKVLKCEILLFVLDGRVPDEGACVELGLAYGDKRFNKPDKLLLGLMTDSRAAFIGSKLNPMIGQALDKLFTDSDELVAFLKDKVAT